jgi:hypothetical protein
MAMTLTILFSKGEEIHDESGDLIATVARDVFAGDDPFALNNFVLADGARPSLGDYAPEPVRKFVVLRMGLPYTPPKWLPSKRDLEFLFLRAAGESYQSIAKVYGWTARTRKRWAWVRDNIADTLKKMRHFGMTATIGAGSE